MNNIDQTDTTLKYLTDEERAEKIADANLQFLNDEEAIIQTKEEIGEETVETVIQ
jgi:hypothetical protein